MPRPSDIERARLFVSKARPSIAGQHGHDALFAVACGLVVGFALGDSDAWALLQEYNAASCNPAWSEKDLRRKFEHAKRIADRNPDKVGELLREHSANYTGPRSPANPPAPKKASQAPSRGGSPPNAPPRTPSRTPRTPFFNVHRFGEGGDPRTLRTSRTVVFASFTQSPSPTPLDNSKKEPSEEYKKPEAPKPTPAQVTKAPSPKPQPKPAQQSTRIARGETVTTVWRSGEVTREHSDGRVEQRRPVDPLP